MRPCSSNRSLSQRPASSGARGPATVGARSVVAAVVLAIVGAVVLIAGVALVVALGALVVFRRHLGALVVVALIVRVLALIVVVLALVVLRRGDRLGRLALVVGGLVVVAVVGRLGGRIVALVLGLGDLVLPVRRGTRMSGRERDDGRLVSGVRVAERADRRCRTGGERGGGHDQAQDQKFGGEELAHGGWCSFRLGLYRARWSRHAKLAPMRRKSPAWGRPSNLGGCGALGAAELDRHALAGERELHLFASLEDPPLDRGERDLEGVGDLGVGEADDVAEE